MQFVDEARRGNTQLLSAYRARVERQEKRITKNDMRRHKTDVTTMVRHMVFAFRMLHFQFIFIFTVLLVESKSVQENGRKY